MATSKVVLSLAVCLVLVSANAVAAGNPAWYPGPKFPVSANAQAVNTFVGQVEPSGQNRLSGTIFMNENGYKDVQNQQLKDITVVYGPENFQDPILIGSSGPGSLTYVQDPSMEGGFAEGLNIQFNAKPGYHFVSVSFGVAISAGGKYTDAFFVDGLGSSTVDSGSITVDTVRPGGFSEGKFVATKIYAPQITLVPNQAGVGGATRFVVDNIQYVLERD